MTDAHPKAHDAGLDVAHLCLLDALACAFQALQQPACTKVLGPVVPGATMSFGARVPGTSLQLDPVQAAFNLGTLIGWLDQREPTLATGPGHLSDALGALLSAGDYFARKSLAEGHEPLKVRDVLSALLAADARIPVSIDASHRATECRAAIEVACATSVASLLGGSPAQIRRARELATDDLRPVPSDVTRRPRWWLGDANARGTRLALLALAEGDGATESPVPQPPAQGPRPTVDKATGTRVQERFLAAVALHFPPAQAEKIKALYTDRPRLEALPINELVSLTVRN